MFALNQPVRDEPATYIIIEGAFSGQACDNIMELSKQAPAEAGAQGSDPMKRVCDIHWLPWSPVGGIDSLYKKLAEIVIPANRRFWEFHLGGFLEPLQLTHYRAESGGHYAWHADRGDTGIQVNRKISGTVLLNDGFEGGEFELFDTNRPERPLQRGDVILFPSFHVHRVTPVTKGERWSLVFWLTGPPFV